MQDSNNIQIRDHDKLITGMRSMGIELTETQLAQFDRFYELLIEWNEKMNLTGITEYEEVIQKHFIDSASLVKVYDADKIQRQCQESEKNGTSSMPAIKILDMGTGAGFPGIPLKIVFPEVEFVLMDSLNKRINFLNEVIRVLGLTKITAVHARAEEYARKPEYREQFDLCVSRAVARLNTLAEFCMPFVKPGGLFIPYKSGKIQEELEEADYAIRLLGGDKPKVEAFTLPNSDIERTFVCIKKKKETPSVYPRAGGKPLKAPLIKQEKKEQKKTAKK
ncbi:MAG: 16S rRNA (guanine(527)-N(7))-methyltransferase RsmG [Lachnospiraceae bacterium]|nr:16S rRNA (guanine(527)-N(7))-methyltransferase RsmG [Lachnospiraceae bacterium]